MPYSAQSDGESRYGVAFILSISDRDGDAAVDTPNPIDDAITDGDAIIDGYLALRYETPITSALALPLLRKLSVDIWVYGLCNQQDVLSKELTKRYERAISMLEMIGQGKMALPGAADSSAQIGVEIEANDRQFTRCKMRLL